MYVTWCVLFFCHKLYFSVCKHLVETLASFTEQIQFVLPFTRFLQMDSRATSRSSSVAAGPSSLWRLAERRSRKAGSGNIFSSVNLWQLQRLFRAAGDQDAEQRAQLVWGHRDEAELAQALIGLRTRSHRPGLRTNRRDALGSHWLRAFNHLR